MNDRNDREEQNDPLKRLGAAMRALRGKRTQTEVGNLLGVPQTTVSRWEHGLVDLGVEQVRRIEDALDAPRGTLSVEAGLMARDAVSDRQEIHITFLSSVVDACDQMKAAEELGLGVEVSNRWRPGPDGSATSEWVVRLLTEPGEGADNV